MNTTIKDFSTPLKIAFPNWAPAFDSICHHASLGNSVVIRQLPTDEEKGPCYGRAVLARRTAAARSWPARWHILAESSSIIIRHCRSTSHTVGCCVSHQLAIQSPCPLGTCSARPVVAWKLKNRRVDHQQGNVCCCWSSATASCVTQHCLSTTGWQW